MKRMLLSCALLLLCALSTGLLQAQLEEDFTPNPPNWILANGYSIHNDNGNDVILSPAGSNPGTIGTPIVQKAANTNTVTYCFDVFGYTEQDGLGELPCATTVDLYFTSTTVNNANDLDETDPARVFGTVKGLAVPAAGGRVCHAFTFPASVTETEFRVFLVIDRPECMGNTRFAFDNFSINGLSEVCTGSACPPVALPDRFLVAAPILNANLVLYGPNASYPAPPAGFLVSANGLDNDPNDAYADLTWTLLTPPANATVTMNPPAGGQGTATVVRNDLFVTQVDFVYQLCDPDGNCDTAAVTMIFPAGGAMPISLLSFNGNRSGSMVSLRWITATESNNAGFEVQRIVNGQYKTVGFVDSKANGGSSDSKLSYVFNEMNNANAVSWYRLVQVNRDGTKEVLPALAIRGLEDLKKLLIYPNPGRTVNVLFGNSSIRDILIFDLGGRQVKSWNSYSEDNLTISDLQAGMYMMQVIDKNTSQKTISKLLISK